MQIYFLRNEKSKEASVKFKKLMGIVWFSGIESYWPFFFSFKYWTLFLSTTERDIMREREFIEQWVNRAQLMCVSGTAS